MSRKLRISSSAAAAVALATVPAWLLPGAAAAAEHARLSVSSARSVALNAAAAIVDSMATGAAARVTSCRRVAATRVDCHLRITAAPSYVCTARAVVRDARAPRVVLRDAMCIG